MLPYLVPQDVCDECASLGGGTSLSAMLWAPFCCLNWFEIQHGGTNKVANEVVEGHINHSVHV